METQLGCFHCLKALDGEMLLCSCEQAAYCSYACYKSFLDGGHAELHIGPREDAPKLPEIPKRDKSPPRPGGDTPIPPAEPKKKSAPRKPKPPVDPNAPVVPKKPRKPKLPTDPNVPPPPKKAKTGKKEKMAALSAVKKEAEALTKEIVAKNKEATNVIIYRRLLENAGSTYDRLLALFKRLRPIEYYPYVLRNQSSGTQPRLDLRGPRDKPVVISVLSSPQRLVADTFGPWSGVRGGFAEWDTGMGKTVLVHTIIKNYRHELVEMPVLAKEPSAAAAMAGLSQPQSRICLVVTEAQLRGDVMKDAWSQDNRSTEWICAQIRAAGLLCSETASPFSAIHVLTGRQLTNAMSGKGPLGRALWSGLYPGEDNRVKLVQGYPRVPTAYRQVNIKGETVWRSHQMRWVEEKTTGKLAFEITIRKLLSNQVVDELNEKISDLLPGFPAGGQKNWKDKFSSLTVEARRTQKWTVLKVVVEWETISATPTPSKWSTYLKMLLPHMRRSWKPFQALDKNPESSLLSIRSVALPLAGEANPDETGYELLLRKNNKLEWVRRRPGHGEIEYNPFDRVTLLIDEAHKFWEPDQAGGGVPDLDLFNAVVKTSPGLVMYNFTATSDFITGSGIFRTLVPTRDLVPVTASTLLPATNLAAVKIPTFSQDTKLDYGSIEEQAAGVVEDGEFNEVALYRIKNAVKGLYSVATAKNRDYFATLHRNPPVEYQLSLEHAKALRAMMRGSPKRFGEAILWYGNEVAPVYKLSSTEFDPNKVVTDLLRAGGLPGAKAFCETLRNNDRVSQAALAERAPGQLYKQAAYSTLQSDDRAVDLYASLMQSVGYNWIPAVRRRIDRTGWSPEKLAAEQEQRRSGKVDQEFREVFLDTTKMSRQHVDEAVVQYGPLNTAAPANFVVLSESLIVDAEAAVQPTNLEQLIKAVRLGKTTLTGFQFESTKAKLVAGGFVFQEPALPPAPIPPVPPTAPREGASRSEEAAYRKLLEEFPAQQTAYEAERDAYENAYTNYKDRQRQFDEERSSLKKLQLHYWPGSGAAESYVNLLPASEQATFRAEPRPRWFVMKRQTDEAGEVHIAPKDITELLRSAMPGQPAEVTFEFVRGFTVFNFYMSENEKQDLLASVVELWNNSTNAYGQQARFVLYGGNYLQGFDLNDTLLSTALHPAVNRSTEVQATGRTNRRNGMLNIPFHERTLRLTTLVAQWPPNEETIDEERWEQITVEQAMERSAKAEERAESEDGGEKRYGVVKSEYAVLSAIDVEPLETKETHALTSNERVAPYMLWRMRTEDPSLSALRLEGRAEYRKFAIDASFNELAADQGGPTANGYSSTWKMGPTKWSLVEHAVLRKLEETNQAVVRQTALHQAPAEASESDDEWAARLSGIATNKVQDFAALPDNVKPFILDGLRAENPRRIAPIVAEPPALIQAKVQQTQLEQLIRMFKDSAKANWPLYRRLAFASEDRSLLLSNTPTLTKIDGDFVMLLQDAFGYKGPPVGFLAHLFANNYITWQPAIEKITLEEEEEEKPSGGPAPPESSSSEEGKKRTVPGPAEPKKRQKMSEMQLVRIQSRLIGAAKEVPVEPFSNVLEAISFPDDEHEVIEAWCEEQLPQDPEPRTARKTLEMLGYWELELSSNVAPALLEGLAKSHGRGTAAYMEAVQLEAIYAKFGLRREELKLAIMEFTFFGVLNWRRALRLLAHVLLSKRIAANTPMLRVARLIGMLYYMSTRRGYSEIHGLILTDDVIMNVTFDQLFVFYQLQYEWSSAETPFETENVKALGADLTVLYNLLKALHSAVQLDIFSDIEKIKLAFQQQTVGRLGARTAPPQDVFDFLVQYMRRGSGAEPAPLRSRAGEWADMDYVAFLRKYSTERNLDIAKAEAGKKVSIETKRLNFAVQCLGLGSVYAQLTTVSPALFPMSPTPTLPALLQTLQGHSARLVTESPMFAPVLALFVQVEQINHAVTILAGIIAYGFESKSDVQSTKDQLASQIQMLRESEATGFVSETGAPVVISTTTRTLFTVSADGSIVQFDPDATPLSSYKLDAIRYASDAPPSKEFATGLIDDLVKVPGIVNNNSSDALRAFLKQPAQFTDFIRNRSYGQLREILSTAAELLIVNFYTIATELVPPGKSFSSAYFARLHRLLSVFDSAVTRSVSARAMLPLWTAELLAADPESHLTAALKSLVKDQNNLDVLKAKFEAVHQLYSMIGVSDEVLFTELAKLAISAELSRPAPGKEEEEAIPKLEGWQRDTRQIWIELPKKKPTFVTRWAKYMQETARFQEPAAPEFSTTE